MKHLFPQFIAACLVGISVVHAAESSEKMQSASATDPTVYFNNFSNRKFPGMKLWCGFHICADEGVNGTPALRIRLPKALKKDSFCLLELPELPAGKRFRVSFDICGKNLKFEGSDAPDMKFECARIEERNLQTKKNRCFGELLLCHPEEDYQKMVFHFTAQKDCLPRLVFRLPAKWSGILLIDNVRVTDQAPEK